MSESYYVPIDPVDLRRIGETLRARDVFTPTFAVPEADRYDPAVYLHEARAFATSTVLLVDRNMLTRWVGMIRGTEPTAEHRLAAGVLAFAQCAGIDIEPSLALYEVARSQGQDAARDELLTFRVADHVHPGYWAEIALGKADTIGELPAVVPVYEIDLKVNFSMWLRRWRRNYVLSLKIAELELEGGGAAARMSRLMRWMYHDFLLGGPAVALAARYLAPNGPRKRILKGIRSADRQRALKGVRNAAWDLTLISEWLLAIERQTREARLTLLASLDRGVHALARSIVALDDKASDVGDLMRTLFVELWGEQVGSVLAAELLAYDGLRDHPERQLNRPAEPDFVSRCIERGETSLLGWAPSRRDV